MHDDVHSVHAARIAHDFGDVHVHNDNGALERSNVGGACNNILGCNTSTEVRFCKRSNHSKVQFVHKRNRLKEN